MNEGSFAFCATVLCSTFYTSIMWLCCPLLERSGQLFKPNVICGDSVQSSPGGLFLLRERTGWKASVSVWFSLSSPVLVSSVRLDVSHYYFPSATWLVPSHALMMLFAKWIMWFLTAGWGAKREETGLSSLIIRAWLIYHSTDVCGRYHWHISICLIFFYSLLTEHISKDTVCNLFTFLMIVRISLKISADLSTSAGFQIPSVFGRKRKEREIIWLPKTQK